MRPDFAQFNRALLILGLGLLAGCAGARTGAPGPPGGESASRLPALPAPAALRSASFTEAGLMRQGSDYAASLPLRLVAAAGSDLSFTPGAGGTSADLAYAVYAFGVEAYDRDMNLQLTWAAPPAAGQLWVALANFSTNRWTWHQPAASDQLDFTNLADYVGPGHALYAVVMLRGAGDATLDRLRIGTQPVTGQPQAVLGADVTNGAAPLAVQFSAGASSATPPATLEKFEFNFGEGAGFEDYGTTSSASHVYAADGNYSAQVRVTDVFGGTDLRTLAITVGTPPASYDETENNDRAANANALPAFPFSGFTGSCGGGGAYDGDDSDFFWLSAGAGDTLTLTLAHGGGANLDLYLYDNIGNFLTGASSLASPDAFTYTVPPGAGGTLVLEVVAFVGNANYTLSGLCNVPSARLAVTPLTGPAPLIALLDASASSDQPGGVLTFEFDPEGDGTFLPAQSDPTFSFIYMTPGIFRPAVRVTDDDTNSATATSIVIPGNLFDEREDNDSRPTANTVTLPIANFRGSLGSGAGYPEYDGDALDYIEVTNFFNVGMTISVQLHSASATGDINVAIMDSVGSVFAASSGGGDDEGISFRWQGGGMGGQNVQLPLYIRVTAASGYSDYSIDASIS